MRTNQKKWALVGLIIALAITSCLYRIIGVAGYNHSALMFVGIPTILAILLISSAPTRSRTGQVFKGVTLFLLIVGILAWEGLICILMAAPIFYLFAAIVLWFWNLMKNRSRLHCVVLFPIALLSIEGTNQMLSLDRGNSIEIDRKFAMSEADFVKRISLAPDFNLDLPLFFKIGFPCPITASSEAVSGVDQTIYIVKFSGPENMGNRLRVRGERVHGDKIEFEFLEDTTKIGSWLTWKEASVEWFEEGDGISVKFKLNFQRDLDPSWYFTPIQNYAVKLAGNHLLNAWVNESN